jgi:hypothetical protein
VIPVFFRIIRYLAVVLVMLLVWTVFLMVYFEWFVPPFNLLIPVLTPWKMMFLAPAQTTLEGRLSFMQELLDDSRIIASTSFVVMAISFMTLSGYAIFIYQQRQRRSRENVFPRRAGSASMTTWRDSLPISRSSRKYRTSVRRG